MVEHHGFRPDCNQHGHLSRGEAQQCVDAGNSRFVSRRAVVAVSSEPPPGKWYDDAAQGNDRRSSLAKSGRNSCRKIKNADRSERFVVKHFHYPIPAVAAKTKNGNLPSRNLPNRQGGMRVSIINAKPDSEVVSTSDKIRSDRSVEIAARACGVSEASVRRAMAIRDADLLLFEQVKRGEITLGAAYKQIKDSEGKRTHGAFLLPR